MNERNDIRKSTAQRRIPKKLTRSALALLALHWSLMMVLALLVNRVCPSEFFWRCFTATMLVLVFVHFQFGFYLKQNHPPGNMIFYPSVGFANHITIARGWGISLMAGFIFIPLSEAAFSSTLALWLPGLIYLLVGCADFLDGLWARVSQRTSVLGQKLDVDMDALGLLIASVLSISWGRLPKIYLVVGFSYYIFQFGKWILKRRGKRVHPLKERPFARVMAGIQMVFVGLSLLPLFAVPLLHLAAFYFLLPFLAGFLWDWLTIQNPPTEEIRKRVKKRTGIALSVLPLVSRMGILFSCWPVAGVLRLYGGITLSGIWLILATMIIIGFLGRFAAIIAACLLAYAAEPIITLPITAAYSACIVLIMTGTGHYSWWRPEDMLMTKRFGGFEPDSRMYRSVQN
jgi:CDP-diacylglycerol--glycerol-3-phosphate 3-phosphatidyltransferase